MKIKFDCPDCGKKYTTEVEFAGKPFKCKHCNKITQVPALPIFNVADDKKASERSVTKISIQNTESQRVNRSNSIKPIKSRAYRRFQGNKAHSIKSKAWMLIPIVLGIVVIAVIALSGTNIEEKTEEADKVALQPEKPTLELPEIQKFLEVKKEEDSKDIENNELEKIEKKLENEEEVEKLVDPLVIVSSFPEFLMVEFEESIELQATGGVKPYNWLVSTGRLPDGMTFIDNKIVGAPDQDTVGKHTFTLRCIDAEGNRVEKEYNCVVDEMLMFNYEEFPNVVYIGTEINYEFTAQGGRKPYTFELIDKKLPFGLKYDPETRKLTGKPANSGEYYINIKVTDSLGRSNENSTETFILNIYKLDNSEIKNKEDDETDDDSDDLDPEPIDPPKTQLQLLMEQGAKQHNEGDYKGAIETYKEALELDSNNAYAFYNIACAYGRLKEKKEAYEYLEKAVGAGFVDYNYIEEDEDLKILRHYSRFKALIKKLKERYNVLENPSNKPLEEQFPGYLIYKDETNKLIFLTNIGSNEEKSKKILDYISNQLMAYAKAQSFDYYNHKRDSYIKILLPDDKDFAIYRKQAGYSEIIGGWYNPVSKFLISKTMGHTLIHEFTHALQYADTWPRGIWHGVWFSEGMATCFENSKLPEGSRENIDPIHNWRLELALDMLYEGSKQFVTFKKFLKLDRNSFLGTQNIQYHYAEARYIVYWLYKIGKLKDFYKAYGETYKKDKSGIKALEDVLDKKLSDIEEDWKAWMQTIVRPQRGVWVGVSTSIRENPQGVKIDKVYKNSPAKEAGLKRGDIILRVGSIPVDTTNNFAYALTTFEPGAEIEIVFIRREEVHIIKVKLVYKEDHKGY